jgi:hypothetical protein
MAVIYPGWRTDRRVRPLAASCRRDRPAPALRSTAGDPGGSHVPYARRRRSATRGDPLVQPDDRNLEGRAVVANYVDGTGARRLAPTPGALASGWGRLPIGVSAAGAEEVHLPALGAAREHAAGREDRQRQIDLTGAAGYLASDACGSGRSKSYALALNSSPANQRWPPALRKPAALAQAAMAEPRRAASETVSRVAVHPRPEVPHREPQPFPA